MNFNFNNLILSLSLQIKSVKGHFQNLPTSTSGYGKVSQWKLEEGDCGKLAL